MTKPRLVPVRGDGSIPPVPEWATGFRIVFRDGSVSGKDFLIRHLDIFRWDHVDSDDDIAAIEWVN